MRGPIQAGKRCQSWAWELGKRMKGNTIDVFGKKAEGEGGECAGQES